MIVAEDDIIVVYWRGHATTLDGKPYDNTYCWIMRVQDGTVREATAFFDAPPLMELWERITA
jgi:ketosteroid isomerase-like protein